MRTLFLVVYCLFNLVLFSKNKDRIWIESNDLPRENREAILILPGLGSKKNGTQEIAKFFFGKGYDVFIPDYISRKSLSNCVQNLDAFLEKNGLLKYKKLHVFSYLLGSWTINKWLLTKDKHNIHAIVYDRSPFQERVPYALVHDIPFLIKIISGKVVRDFANTPYPIMKDEKIKVGILIENKATKLFLKHKKSALMPGEINWQVEALKQVNVDHFYVMIDHDEIYYQMDAFAEEILYFIKNHKFSANVSRKPLPLTQIL